MSNEQNRLYKEYLDACDKVKHTGDARDMLKFLEIHTMCVSVGVDFTLRIDNTFRNKGLGVIL